MRRREKLPVGHWRQKFGDAAGVEHWHFYAYEYLDDLYFMLPAEEIFEGWDESSEIISKVRDKLLSLGWAGDGQFLVMWFPPFAGVGTQDDTGSYALQVKQNDDGISWIASPHALPFHRLFQPDDASYPDAGKSPWEQGSYRKGMVRWLSDLDSSNED